MIANSWNTGAHLHESVFKCAETCKPDEEASADFFKRYTCVLKCAGHGA